MNVFLKKHAAPILFVVLGFVPIVRWFFMLPLDFRFADLNSTFTSLGQIAGLLGMAFFALTLILAARSKILDKFFYGLPDVYDVHQRLGQVSFILLLLHPLFLVVKFLGFSLQVAAIFLLPHGFDAVSYGIYALVGMIVLIALTIYVKLKYPTWKISHKFMVLVFVVALMHVLLIESDISNDIFIRYYIFTLSIIALTLSFYQAFLSMFLNRNYEYVVKQVNQLNSGLFEVKLEPKNKKIEFKTGQFVFVKFFSKALSRETHPFSISSGPENKNLEIVVKSLGDYTSKINNLKAGDKAVIEGPFGKFSFKNMENKNQIWLAGGVGITPFISMARDLGDSDYKVDLYYCTKNKEEAVLTDELLKIAESNKNFRLIAWCSDEKGFVNAKAILEISKNILEKDILMCGPTGFMKSLEKQFLQTGVKNKNIYFEDFSFI